LMGKRAAQVKDGSISLLERNRQMTKFAPPHRAEEQAQLEVKPAEVGAIVGCDAMASPNPDRWM